MTTASNSIDNMNLSNITFDQWSGTDNFLQDMEDLLNLDGDSSDDGSDDVNELAAPGHDQFAAMAATAAALVSTLPVAFQNNNVSQEAKPVAHVSSFESPLVVHQNSPSEQQQQQQQQQQQLQRNMTQNPSLVWMMPSMPAMSVMPSSGIPNGMTSSCIKRSIATATVTADPVMSARPIKRAKISNSSLVAAASQPSSSALVSSESSSDDTTPEDSMDEMRRERNRRHARQSRQRKKDATEQLQHALLELGAENAKLRNAIHLRGISSATECPFVTQLKQHRSIVADDSKAFLLQLRESTRQKMKASTFTTPMVMVG